MDLSDVATNSTETFLDAIATNSAEQCINTILSKSTCDTALDDIATSSSETFFDVTTANLTDTFVDMTAQNSTGTYFDINATNITTEVFGIVGVSSYESVFDIVSACLYICVALAGATGNIMVCYIVYTNKKLRTPSNIQLVSLAITDVLVCTLTSLTRFGFTVNSLLHGEINIKGPLCTFQIFILYSSSFTTIISLAAISVARAIGVADICSRSTKRKVIFILIVVTWVTGIGYGTLKAWAGEDLTCNLEPISQVTRNASRGGILIVFLSLLTMVVSYSYIYHVTNRHEKSFQRAMEAAGSRRQTQRKPMNLATLKVFVLLISMFTISYLPAALYGSLVVNIDRLRNEHFGNFILSLVCFGSLINPIIYSLTSNQFKNYLPFNKKTSINEIQLRQRYRTGTKPPVITPII
ncbi:rhodopsin, GQ-coupled-like [Saccoglossus kowalevskii]|uniref:Melanopsin-like n=1 Tax=Saccoglossus kowalevskii TaxID=10224 RepID=A0ABM0LWX3_SACKO|nr:PREDICTED: melanopsin-like [Saccoglossus kowalevskii]